MNDILFLLLFFIFYLVGHYSTQGYKSQYVRILDFVLYGPVLSYVAYNIMKKEKSPYFIGLIVLFIGSTTISYNLRNYLKIKKQLNKNN